MYLWKWTDKVVISDIDGTITKSDVLGHVLPIISMDWAQYGVASLFNKIRNNGYQIAYLSARAIGQAPTTKTYLQSVSQEDLNLPGRYTWFCRPICNIPLISVKAIILDMTWKQVNTYRHFVF